MRRGGGRRPVVAMGLLDGIARVIGKEVKLSQWGSALAWAVAVLGRGGRGLGLDSRRDLGQWM